ncbi:MAG: Lrp/AsnC family transcriptional regulator [Arenibacterium sp.]
MPELDDTDEKLIRILRRDARISNAELAERTGLSPSSCWRRVRALEDSGVIRRYTISVDDAKRGQTFQAIVHVQLTRHDPAQLAEFVRAIQTNDSVQECFATTGQSDYHLMVRCRDLHHYNRFLEEFLFRLPAVASAQTNLVLRSLKEKIG